MNLKGQLKINVYKNIDGHKFLIDSFDEHNLIVSSGKQLMAFLMAGEPGNHRVTKIGVGENSDLPTATDTGLQNAFIKPVDGYTILEATVVQWNFQILASEANGLNIFEFGLFSQDEQLFSRKVRTNVIPKDDSISIEGDWTIWLFECQDTSFSSWVRIQTVINAPEISSFNAAAVAPSIVTNIDSNIRTERHFTASPVIGWAITSAMFLPFSITANIAFEITSDLEYITHREFSVAPGIIFNTQSDMRLNNLFNAAPSITFSTSSDIDFSLTWTEKGDF